MTKTGDVSEAIVVERTLDAPVAQVWAALTDVEQMRKWYLDCAGDTTLKEFIPEVGFEFAFVVTHEGNEYHHLCQVTEVIPERKIAYTWRYKGEPGNSLVTFELFSEREKTRLKLTHVGLETFPKTAAFARENFENGWARLIGSELKELIEKNWKHNHDYENSR